ncbi:MULTISPECIES: DJ-1/PfpI family protein [unclassified Variovorax]|uniref:DJ-1/PfpI family protein n=1 Tax=unclassified Variovorax TaxID=663243 RepID=UPI00076D17BB|nr:MULTISPECIES: DJ-1/PfpI family protein [unclassified Variovorax]KWT94045.1 putative transcriptional regulator [Variovorax sp. WDL1]PNG59993.1 Isonitrile hydratase [Variovorax sp. B4]PNG60215.1 Isonitrile hydratase [Variovorax sp. B2]VTV13953.1 Isonitrile hydratase [Variovorax sp. WDL1]
MWNWVRASIGTSIAALVLAGCGAGAPQAPAQDDAATIARDRQAFVEALKPRAPGRPVVAVLALNEGTEMTDLLLPHAVLQRAGVADVRIVAPRAGRVSLYPAALEIDGAQDLAGFDRMHPSGADYVIVPAMRTDDDPAVTAWLQRQALQGARVIGVCSGARVVGRAGLLDGRRFAGHWYDRSTLLRRHPGATYVPNRRYVVDRGVATTTGITASVPTTLALVEAIGGRDRAQALAAELGVATWDPAHDSAPFKLEAARAWTYVVDKATFWRDERWRVEVRDGSDDVSLALAADAWSRTGRVSVEAASASGPVRLKSGLVLIARAAAGGSPRVPISPSLRPVQQLDRTLCEIAERHGTVRRDRVMQEMEYPRVESACGRTVSTAGSPRPARRVGGPAG